MNEVEIREKFAYHPPVGEGVAAAHEAIRERGLEFALWLNRLLISTEDAKDAIHNVDLAVRAANACVARVQQVNVEVLDG
ncbi:MAG TPA: hypothetical protein VGO82_12570 [Enterovirga sp.]|nr:hypothetical protein [Enterovirga sp.]